MTFAQVAGRTIAALSLAVLGTVSMNMQNPSADATTVTTGPVLAWKAIGRPVADRGVIVQCVSVTRCLLSQRSGLAAGNPGSPFVDISTPPQMHFYGGQIACFGDDCHALGTDLDGLYLLDSDDAAATWQVEAKVPVFSTGTTKFELSCATITTCFVASASNQGLAAMISRTSNGGETWTEFPFSAGLTNANVLLLNCVTIVRCYLTLGDDLGHINFLMSTDSGTTWKKVRFPFPTNRWQGVNCPTPVRCYLWTSSSSSSRLFTSTDGGSTWVPTGLSLSADEPLFGPWCATTNRCWFFGFRAGALGTYATTDGGSRWTFTQIRMPTSLARFRRVPYVLVCASPRTCTAAFFKETPELSFRVAVVASLLRS